MKNNINLALYDELKSQGFTRGSILIACGYTIGRYRRARNLFTAEETKHVACEVQRRELKISRKAMYCIDMDKVLEKVSDGVTVAFLAKKHEIPYRTLLARVQAMKSKEINE